MSAHSISCLAFSIVIFEILILCEFFSLPNPLIIGVAVNLLLINILRIELASYKIDSNRK